jgi:hypothetical protein
MPTVIDGQKSGVAQPGEVRGDQLTPLLALAALRSEVRGYRSDIFVNRSGLHPQLPTTSLAHARPLIEQPWAQDFAGSLIFP